MPTPVGPRRNDPIGRFYPQSGTGAPDGIGYRIDGRALSNHTLAQPLLHPNQFRTLALLPESPSTQRPP